MHPIHHFFAFFLKFPVGKLRQAGLGAGLPWTVPRPRQGLLLACRCAPTSFGTFCSRQHCSAGDGGWDSPSSGEVAHGVGKVPCEFGPHPPKRSRGYPWGECILTSFGTFAPGSPASRGRETSTFRLRGTPPHTPAHLPTKFHPNRSNFFFRGVFTQGPGSNLPQVSGINPGEAPSPAPLERGIRGLPFRGGQHVPVTLPRGRTPASTLVF